MNAGPANDPRRGRRGLVALAALFMVPLAAAFWLYYGQDGWHPSGTTNKGDLVDPARPLPRLSFRDPGGRPVEHVLGDRWTILYVGDGRCDARCEHVLYVTRQTRIALNKDIDRVRRVFVAMRNCCDRRLAAEHPDLAVVTLRGNDTARLLAALPSYAGVPADGAGRVYLVDPLGNLMMSYAPAAPDHALLDDLTRLLRVSHIG